MKGYLDLLSVTAIGLAVMMAVWGYLNIVDSPYGIWGMLMGWIQVAFAALILGTRFGILRTRFTLMHLLFVGGVLIAVGLMI